MNSTDKHVLSVVVPVYNEEGAIGKVLDNIKATRKGVLEKFKDKLAEIEVLIVNDGSSDASGRIIQERLRDSPGFRIIDHPANRGYGAALQTGMKNARGDLVSFFDADDTFKFENTSTVLQEYFDSEAEMIAGCRFTDVSGMPLIRRFGNNFFRYVIYMLTYEKVRDPSTGIRIIEKKTLEDVLLPLPDGLNFIIVMTTRSLMEGVTFKEVHIPYDERIGESKLEVRKDGIEFLKSIISIVVLHNPFKMFFLGMSMAILLMLIMMISPMIHLLETGSLGSDDLPWLMASSFFLNVACLCYCMGILANTTNKLVFKKRMPQTFFSKFLVGSRLTDHFGAISIGLLAVSVCIYVASKIGVFEQGAITLTVVMGLGLPGLILGMSDYVIRHIKKHLKVRE